jgi:hypothetical protein
MHGLVQGAGSTLDKEVRIVADVSDGLAQRASTFFALTQASFHFLEEQYGYRLERAEVRDLQHVLDAHASVSYLGEHVAVEVAWGYADGYIGVGFVELRTPRVRPAQANSLRPTWRCRSLSIWTPSPRWRGTRRILTSCCMAVACWGDDQLRPVVASSIRI